MEIKKNNIVFTKISSRVPLWKVLKNRGKRIKTDINWLAGGTIGIGGIGGATLAAQSAGKDRYLPKWRLN